MKKINTVLGFGLFFIIIGLSIGSTFLLKNQEKRYTELLISVNPAKDLAPVTKVAEKYGFKLEPREYAFSTTNSFTQRHKLYKVSKYDIEPEELASVIKAFEGLKESEIIRAIEPNYHVKAFSKDPLFSKQWNLEQLNIEEVWKKGTGKGVVVAVIDTGVSKNLGDLDPGRLVKGYNFVDRNENFDDGHGHGSHVAGTIGQDTNNNIGVAGIAYEAKIMPLRVLNDSGSGSTMDIAEAIVYATDNGANIINMSLGGGGYSQVLKDACDYAVEKGVTVIAAAGNENQRQSSYPGRYSSVISVAASSPGYERSFYSNYGEGVDVIAPGGEMNKTMGSGILQNGPDFLSRDFDKFEKESNNYFYYFQGTSMASPHVAGIAAILYQNGITKPEEIRQNLVASSEKTIENLPFVNPLGALEKKAVEEVIKEPVKPDKPRFNSGAITTSPVTSILTLVVALGMLILFQKTRKKINTIDNILRPQTFLGLLIGANGLALAGFFFQNMFPFNILPERFSGLLFNSILDYDRVLFFLAKPSLFWHNLFIPVIFMILLNFKDNAKRCFSVGLLLGFAAKLIADGIFVRQLGFMPDGFFPMLFLVVNGLITFTLPYILVKNE